MLNEKIPHTAVIEVRTDARMLCTLDEYLRSKGVTPRSKSHLASLGVQLAAELLVSTGVVVMETSTEVAHSTLTRRYGEFNKKNRNKRSLIEQLSLEDSQDFQTKLVKEALKNLTPQQ